MSIPLTVVGLAKFMNAGPLRQRSILRDFKFPTLQGQDKRKAQIVYYSEARTAIREYHSSGNSRGALSKAETDLRMAIERAPEKNRDRLEHNIRGIESYGGYFSERRFEILPLPKPKYRHGEVVISATPDLFVLEGGVRKLLKLDFNKEQPKDDVVDVILKVMYEAATLLALRVRPKDVVYLDVTRGIEYNGSKLGVRLKRDIDAACENVEAMWPGIKR